MNKKIQNACPLEYEEIKFKSKLEVMVYKTLKENYARAVAQEYKDKIPPKIYNSIMMFTVDLDD